MTEKDDMKIISETADSMMAAKINCEEASAHSICCISNDSSENFSRWSAAAELAGKLLLQAAEAQFLAAIHAKSRAWELGIPK